MNKYIKLVSDTGIFAIGNFTTKLIYFVLMPIYTLTLTTSEFGFADLLNNSLQLLIPILTLCIADAVFRFALEKDADYSKLLNNGLRVIISSTIIVLILMSGFSLWKKDLIWLIYGILYFSESLKLLFAQFVRSRGMVKPFAINGIIAAVILLVCTYIFLKLLNGGVAGYLWAFICANSAAIAYLLFKIKIINYISFKQYDKALLKSMLIYSLPLAPNMASWWITNISSRYIIAGYLGMGVAGLFSAASKLPALVNVVSSIFQLSWQYASVKEYQESSQSEFYSKVFEYYSLVITFTGIILITLIPYISMFVLKGNFYEAWKYTPLLLYSAIICCYSIYFGTFYSVIKNNKKTLITTFVGAIINLTVCFSLIPIIGIRGALIASVLSYIVITWLRARDCVKIVTLNISWFKLIMGLLLLLLQSIIMMTSLYQSFIISLVPLALIVLYRLQLVSLMSLLGNFIRNIN